MCKVLTEEMEVISHLTPLVGREDALNMVNNFKREVIQEFAEKIKSKIPDLRYHCITDCNGYQIYIDDELYEFINNLIWDEAK